MSGAGSLSSGGGSGNIVSINGDKTAAQTITTASTGTDFTITTTAGVTTVAIPSASATARGLITTGTQTIAGNKTFNGTIFFNGQTFYNSGSTLNLNAGSTLSSNANAGAAGFNNQISLNGGATFSGALAGQGSAGITTTTGDITCGGTVHITTGLDLSFSASASTLGNVIGQFDVIGGVTGHVPIYDNIT